MKNKVENMENNNIEDTTENIRRPKVRPRLTRELILRQIETAKSEITKQLGIIQYCQFLLENIDL